MRTLAIGCVVLLSCSGRSDTEFASIPGVPAISLHHLSAPAATCKRPLPTLLCPLLGPEMVSCSYGLVHVTNPPPRGPPDCDSVATTDVWFPVPEGQVYWFAVSMTGGERRVTVGNGEALVTVHHLDDAGIFASHPAWVPRDAGIAVLSEPRLWVDSFLLADRADQEGIWARWSEGQRFDVMESNLGSPKHDDWWFWFSQLDESHRRVLGDRVLAKLVARDAGLDETVTLNHLAEHHAVLPADFVTSTRAVFRDNEARRFELLLTARGDAEAAQRSCARLGQVESLWDVADELAALALGRHRCGWVPALARRWLKREFHWCPHPTLGTALCSVDASRVAAQHQLAELLPDAGPLEPLTQTTASMGTTALMAALAVQEPLPADVQRLLDRTTYSLAGDPCTSDLRTTVAELPAEVTSVAVDEGAHSCDIFIDDTKRTVRTTLRAKRRNE